MEKKNYQEPDMYVVTLQHGCAILTNGSPTPGDSNLAREYRGDSDEGGSADAQGGGGVWDNEW